MAGYDIDLKFALPIFGIKAKPNESYAHEHKQFALPIFGIKAKLNGLLAHLEREFALPIFGIKAKQKIHMKFKVL